MRSAPAIAFDVRPSRWLAAATALAGACAAVAPWLSAAPAFARVLLSLCALALAGDALRRLARPPFQRVIHGAAGWSVVDAQGREQAAILVGHARLGSLLVLDLRTGPRRRWRAWLPPDALDAEARRRLLLQLARGEPAGDAPA
jgi:toxin CptA